MDTNKDYREAMNRLNEDLVIADRNYFMKLRGYMGLSSLMKDEKAINKQLYQMHLDFLSAQDDGLSAEEFFGNDPKGMANQLLDELPRTSFSNLVKYIGIVAVIIWGMRFISDFISTETLVINPALYLFDLVLVFSLILLLFKVVQRSVYQTDSSKKIEWLEAIVALVVFIAYIVVYLRADQFIPEILPITIPEPWSMLLFLGLLAITVFGFFKIKNQLDNR